MAKHDVEENRAKAGMFSIAAHVYCSSQLLQSCQKVLRKQKKKKNSQRKLSGKRAKWSEVVNCTLLKINSHTLFSIYHPGVGYAAAPTTVVGTKMPYFDVGHSYCLLKLKGRIVEQSGITCAAPWYSMEECTEGVWLEWPSHLGNVSKIILWETLKTENERCMLSPLLNQPNQTLASIITPLPPLEHKWTYLVSCTCTRFSCDLCALMRATSGTE